MESTLKSIFKNFNSLAIDLPVDVVDELSSLDEVRFISTDDEVVSLGHVTSTTGADDVRTQSTTSTPLDGTGIGIAIVDSGIYTEHKSFGARVIYSQDFTGENRVDDPFGHGTHVAAAAAGNVSSTAVTTPASPQMPISSTCGSSIRKDAV